MSSWLCLLSVTFIVFINLKIIYRGSVLDILKLNYANLFCNNELTVQIIIDSKHEVLYRGRSISLSVKIIPILEKSENLLKNAVCAQTDIYRDISIDSKIFMPKGFNVKGKIKMKRDNLRFIILLLTYCSFHFYWFNTIKIC